jgi:hypothetical protein
MAALYYSCKIFSKSCAGLAGLTGTAGAAGGAGGGWYPPPIAAK